VTVGVGRTDACRTRAVATVWAMRSPQRRAVIGALGVTLLLFAATACGSDSNGSTTESTQPAATPSTAAPTEATTAPHNANTTDSASNDPAATVPELLQFTAPLVGGGTFDGATAAAQGKPTVLWFWAPT
jgi:hypothetical protein